MPAIQWKEARFITGARKFEESESDKNKLPIYRVRAVLPDLTYLKNEEVQKEKK